MCMFSSWSCVCLDKCSLDKCLVCNTYMTFMHFSLGPCTLEIPPCHITCYKSNALPPDSSYKHLLQSNLAFASPWPVYPSAQTLATGVVVPGFLSLSVNSGGKKKKTKTF